MTDMPAGETTTAARAFGQIAKFTTEQGTHPELDRLYRTRQGWLVEYRPRISSNAGGDPNPWVIYGRTPTAYSVIGRRPDRPADAVELTADVVGTIETGLLAVTEAVDAENDVDQLRARAEAAEQDAAEQRIRAEAAEHERDARDSEIADLRNAYTALIVEVDAINQRVIDGNYEQ